MAFYFIGEKIVYVDGNQDAGSVLTSDGNGVASWASIPSQDASQIEQLTQAEINLLPLDNGRIAYNLDTNKFQAVENGAWVNVISGPSTFVSNITVSLSGGKTIGKYTNGQVIPSAGKTPEQVFNDVAIEDIAPTYTIPTMSLTKTQATEAEVGTVYASNTLTATFTQNDAGALTNLRIQKNGSDILPNSSSSPLVKVDSGTFVLGNITFIAYSDYNAGIVKNYLPSGTPDPRPPQVRSVNAPQAASTNFASNTLVLTGLYYIFYGDSASAPVTSANVRALPSLRFTNVGNVWNLNTGTTNIHFTVAMPATMSLVSVIDLDALNANITSNYILTTFNVNDAGGTPVSYKVYTMTIGVPYASNHRHQITVS